MAGERRSGGHQLDALLDVLEATVDDRCWHRHARKQHQQAPKLRELLWQFKPAASARARHAIASSPCHIQHANMHRLCLTLWNGAAKRGIMY